MLLFDYNDLFCVLKSVGCIYGGDVEYIDLLLWGGFIFEILWWYYGYLFKGMLIKIKVGYYYGCNGKKVCL